MFAKTQFQTLFAYHFHTNRRLLAGAEKLSQADLHADPGYGRGSIHDVLLHLLRAEQSWRVGLETGQQQPGLPAEDFPDLTALQAGFEAEQAAWEALLEKLSDEEIEGMIEMTTRRGTLVPFLRWRVLQHVLFHGMQHHTELAQLLTEKGQSPGDIDFIFYR